MIQGLIIINRININMHAYHVFDFWLIKLYIYIYVLLIYVPIAV